MSEGMQITIPGTNLRCQLFRVSKYNNMRRSDLDDEEYSTTPTPFGRSGGQTFAFGVGNTSGQDSPTATTPFGISDRAERSFFSHNRGDSVTSDDSTHSVSTRFTATPKSSTPFAHSSQSSIAGPVTKKNSFASIRNAFKSNKSNEPPPVPQIDHQANSVFKSSFNRSTSSLNHGMPTSRPSPSNASPPYPRPQTPGSSNEARFVRGGPSAKAKSHAYSKSQHSHSGSIFQYSDAGSDGHGYPYSSSPPPVPRVPNTFGNNHLQRTDTPPLPDFEEDKIVMDPKTPSDYALHAVFIRFAASAELKIDAFLRQGLVRLNHAITVLNNF